MPHQHINIIASSIATLICISIIFCIPRPGQTVPAPHTDSQPQIAPTLTKLPLPSMPSVTLHEVTFNHQEAMQGAIHIQTDQATLTQETGQLSCLGVTCTFSNAQHHGTLQANHGILPHDRNTLMLDGDVRGSLDDDQSQLLAEKVTINLIDGSIIAEKATTIFRP